MRQEILCELDLPDVIVQLEALIQEQYPGGRMLWWRVSVEGNKAFFSASVSTTDMKPGDVAPRVELEKELE